MKWGLVMMAALILWLALPAGISAQAANDDTSAQRSDDSIDVSRTEIDEEYDLDIAEKHIDLGRLDASAALELHDGERLSLSVGVGISAEDVEITLREVHGHVKFRASLATVLDGIRELRGRLANPPSR